MWCVEIFVLIPSYRELDSKNSFAELMQSVEETVASSFRRQILASNNFYSRVSFSDGLSRILSLHASTRGPKKSSGSETVFIICYGVPQKSNGLVGASSKDGLEDCHYNTPKSLGYNQ
jgi:hypothetical protein